MLIVVTASSFAANSTEALYRRGAITYERDTFKFARPFEPLHQTIVLPDHNRKIWLRPPRR